jgi:hypothetical protein
MDESAVDPDESAEELIREPASQPTYRRVRRVGRLLRKFLAILVLQVLVQIGLYWADEYIPVWHLVMELNRPVDVKIVVVTPGHPVGHLETSADPT